MSLRFFADHCVSNAIIDHLRSQGHEVLRLRDHLDPESPDPIVIARAQELGAILLSLNGDFADIVTYPPSRFGGIVALEVHDHPEVIPVILSRLSAYISSHPEPADYRARLFVVAPHRIRIRQ
jgi:predicted nuclease of predicted toxin-antitoxin system